MTNPIFTLESTTLVSQADIASHIGNLDRDDYKLSILFYAVCQGNTAPLQNEKGELRNINVIKRAVGDKLFPLMPVAKAKGEKVYKFKATGSGEFTKRAMVEGQEQDVVLKIADVLGVESHQVRNDYYPTFVQKVTEYFQAINAKKTKESEEKREQVKTQLETFSNANPTLDKDAAKKAFNTLQNKVKAVQIIVDKFDELLSLGSDETLSVMKTDAVEYLASLEWELAGKPEVTRAE